MLDARKEEMTLGDIKTILHGSVDVLREMRAENDEKIRELREENDEIDDALRLVREKVQPPHLTAQRNSTAQ